MERCLREKASAGRQINNFSRLLDKLVDSKARPETDVNALLVWLQKQRILEIGPGSTTYILDFLVHDLHFNPANLYAVDPTLICDPSDAQIKAGQYKRCRIEKITDAWPKDHFGLIFGFHVLGDRHIELTKLLADQLHAMLTPSGILAISSVNHSNPAPIHSRFGQPVVTDQNLDLQIFIKKTITGESGVPRA
jgi:2-polyprenyl-3-methyl-5-hydroxy-6-metoxy-1,4-benzoquinol methylase